MDLATLRERQGWTLEQKIDHAVGAVEQFKARTGRPLYVSFSGGKDSTVLLDLCRRFLDPEQKAVFNNTGNEYPEIIRFVRDTPNVTIISPRIPVRRIIEEQGFPLISKEQSCYIREAKTTKSAKLLDIRLNGSPLSKGRKVGKISERWKFLVGEPFMISERCCDILKKRPFRIYEKETGELPILGIMAGESRIRQEAYIKRGGCNSFKPDHLSCNRTGCMFCGFGAHIEKESRFDLVFRLHRKMYQTVMGYQNNGITYRDALHKCGISLPDDPKEPTLFDILDEF